jgi:hypothetical protein
MPWNITIVERAAGFDWLSAASPLIGVILGAALTYFVTNRFEERRLREQQLGQAYSMFFVVQKMFDDLVKLLRHIAETKAQAEAEGFKGPLWTILDDVVGYSDTGLTISPDGLALVAATKDVDLLMGVREIESAHRIYLEAIHKLAELRAKLESSGLQIAVEGKTVSYGATPEQYAKIAPTIIRLETLSKSIESGLPEAVARARQVSERLGPHLKKHYKFKHFISVALEVEAPNTPGSAASPNGTEETSSSAPV